MRDIRHDSLAAEAYDEACERWPRADEVWNAMEWTLIHDPTVGKALSESGNVRTYIIQGARSAGWPTLTVIYTIDGDDYITIKDATFEEAGFFQAGTG